MKGYKLTDSNGRTHGETQWGEGVTHTAVGSGTEFCSPDLIHFYTDPLVAILHNPVQANFHKPLLWEVETSAPVYSDNGTKHGAKSVTTLRQLPVPIVPLAAVVRYGILCAQLVYQDKGWNRWAENWLSDIDGTAADAAYANVNVSATAAAARYDRAAARAAARSASASAYAASADDYEAYAYAAYAADYAGAAAAANQDIDFPGLAARAMEETAIAKATSPQARWGQGKEKK